MGVARTDQSQTWSVRKISLGAFLVMFNRTNVSAVGNPNDHGHAQRAFVAECHLCELRCDLIKRRIDKAVELNLDNGSVSAHCKPNRRTDNPRLGEWGVKNSMLTKLRLEALRHTKDATERADVFAHEQNLRVCRHGGLKAQIDGFREREILHAHDCASSSNDASYAANHWRCSSMRTCGSE